MLEFWPSILCASLCSVMLGLLASILGALVGPSLQVLMPGTNEQSFAIVDLIGKKFGSYFSSLLGQDYVNRDDLLYFLPIFLLIIAGSKTFFYTLQSFLWERLGERQSLSMRQDFVASYVENDPLERKTVKGHKMDAELSSSLTTDIKLMREYLVHFYGGLPREIFQVLFLAIILIGLSPKLFIIFFLCVVPVISQIQRLAKKLKRRASQALSDYSSLTEWLQQRMLGIETIKHYKTESFESQRFTDLTTRLYHVFLKAARIKSRTSPLMEMAAICALVCVLLIALFDIQEGHLTGTTAISFFASLAMLSQSAAIIGRYINSNREGSAAVFRLQTLYQYLQKNKKSHLSSNLKFDEKNKTEQYALKCKDISVCYPEENKIALSNFTFAFEKSKIYCISGPSGAGKSTLFKAILQQVEIKSGEIYFSEQKESKLKLGYMPQDIILMSSSIAENICYPEKKYDTKKINQALEEVQLSPFIKNLPEGIKTSIGRDGIGLSGGQAQRLLLARLYYHHFPVILFDEGTSALDPEVEACVYSGLKKLSQNGSCIIMIAHRSSAIQIADQVIRLENGKLSDKQYY